MLTFPARGLTRRRAIEGAALVLVSAAAAVGLARSEIVSAREAPPPQTKTLVPRLVPGTDSAVKRERLSELDLPDIEHPRVDRWIGRFTTDLRESFEVYLERKERYEPMISSKLEARGMPRDLIYLAMIESGFNPRARSPASASGLWQFMGATARQFGLKVNRRVDERNNPARATDAALKYLDVLYDRFGSWYLAAAAYNTGEGRVSRILKRTTGRSRGTDADYYRISGKLPRETRDYVPKLIAAARIGNAPERYGFSAGD